MRSAVAAGRRRLRVWWDILWSPTKAVFVGLYGILQFFQFLRSELLAGREHEWLILRLLPDWPWWGWLIGWLTLFLGITLEGAYRAIEARIAQIRELSADRITDEDVEAVRREIEAVQAAWGMAKQVRAHQRSNEAYPLFQRDGGTLPRTRAEIRGWPDAEKARMKKLYPHLWKWYLEYP